MKNFDCASCKMFDNKHIMITSSKGRIDDLYVIPLNHNYNGLYYDLHSNNIITVSKTGFHPFGIIINGKFTQLIFETKNEVVGENYIQQALLNLQNENDIDIIKKEIKRLKQKCF